MMTAVIALLAGASAWAPHIAPLPTPSARLRRSGNVRAQSDAFDSFSPRPPSDKQIAFAQRLSLQTERPLPHDATVDASACSSFIDELLRQVPASEKQIQYASVLAERAGEQLPDEAIESAAAVTAYIQSKTAGDAGAQGAQAEGGVSWQGGAGSSAVLPTDKQLNFAVRLARQQRVGLPAEVLAYKSECSKFIDSMLNAATEGTAPGAPSVPPSASPPPVVIPDPNAAKPAEIAKPVEVAIFEDDEIPF